MYDTFEKAIIAAALRAHPDKTADDVDWIISNEFQGWGKVTFEDGTKFVIEGLD